LGRLTVPALKEMLRDRGLKVTGNKADLIERLTVAGGP
jgi:Fe2+ or Zn2+ uptake regulation protein